MKESRFFDAALAVVRAIPSVAEEQCFALKGGTAINLFVQDLPRLSVDIDLTYIPIESRDVSLQNISTALERIAKRLSKAFPKAKILKSNLRGSKIVVKLTIQDGPTQVKIEPNTILRGTVYTSSVRSLSKKAEDLFEASASILTVSDADLYAGKYCAALDRQHPRDIFDMKLLLDGDGITDEIRKAFVIYLSGHDRPIHELLNPTRINFKKVFESEFEEMSETPVTYKELENTRETYIKLATSMLKKNERKFLLSLKSGTPDWTLMGIPGIEQLPSLQWKLMNINKMEEKKRKQMLEKLTKVLEK